MLRSVALRRIRLAVSFFFFIQGVVFASWANRIPDVKAQLGLNDKELGSVLFAIPVGQVVAMALSGWLVNRFGSKRMIALGASLYALFLVPLGVAPSIWTLVLSLFLFGMASNLCNAAGNTQAIGVERLYGRTIMASFHALWSLGGFLGGLISMLFAHMALSAWVQFVSVAALAVSSVFVYKQWLVKWDVKAPAVDPELRPHGFKRFTSLLDPFVVFLGVMAFVAMVCEGCMYDWSGVYFAEVVCVSEGNVQLGYVVCLCAMTCGRLISDRFVTRFGRRMVVLVSGLLIFSGMMLSVALPMLVPATIGFALIGLGISSTVPICYSLAGHSQKVNSATAVTTVASVGYLGFLLGPPVIGHLAHAFTLHVTFGIMAFMGLALSLGALRLPKRD